jgi:hypothetical protein
MPDTKISALATAPSLAGSEEFPINQGGVSRKATTAQLRALANALPEPATINAPATLNHDHYGKIVYVRTAGIITLPPAPQSTEVLRILNGSAPAGNISIAGTGSEVKVGPGKDVTFLSISSGWVRMQPAVEGAGSASAPYIRNRFDPMSATARLVSNISPSTAPNTVYFQPFVLPNDMTINALAVQVATAGVAGSTGALAVYASNPANVQPTGTPVAVGTAAFAADTTGVKSVDLGTGPTLFGGTVYFFALNTSAATKFVIDEMSTAANLLGNTSASIGTGAGRSLRSSQGSAPMGGWPDMTSLPSYGDNGFFFGSFKAA